MYLKPFWSLTLCFSSLGTLSLLSYEPPALEKKEEANKKHYRVSVRHIEGGGIGYSEGYTTVEGFFAPNPAPLSVIPFLDLRAHIFNNGKIATNAGFGLRGILGSRVYGLNTYYDYRNTNKLHYNQVGFGLETLGPVWDVRVNGYLPVGKKITSPYAIKFGQFFDHELLLSQKRQFAMKGAEAELGFHFGKSKNFEFYGAAGPYYYLGPLGPNTWGGKIRLNGMYKEYITLELSNSYDNRFHNNFQGQLTFNIPFGRKSDHKSYRSSKIASRLVQPVGREEIIVVGKQRQNTPAINPVTHQPYFFVFVDNTSHSSGTYQSPYHSLAQAEQNSSIHDIIYVFPGDGTTQGMDSGILLKANQKFWGSGTNHLIQTTQGTITIPAQSNSYPTITNTNIDTEGNAITLGTNNAIKGFTITGALNNAIYGTDPQNLEVCSCIITNNSTYTLEASFSNDASILLTNNQFLNNVNGLLLTLNDTSSFVCSNNIFKNQSSSSTVPLTLIANNNTFSAQIDNNIFDSNTTGSVLVNLNQVASSNISLINNSITNNETGFVSILGSSFVLLPTDTTDSCSITLEGNTFSTNTSSSVYLYNNNNLANQITTFNVVASKNTMSNNGGSAIVLAIPSDSLTLLATDNIIQGLNDNGIAVIANGLSTTGSVTINNNTVTNIAGSSNGIAINQDFSTLNLTLLNNVIDSCEGSGVLSYAPTGINSLRYNISDNTISNCQNLSSNAAAGIDIEQYINSLGSITQNTLSGNTGLDVCVGSTLTSPTICLTLNENQSSNYLLSNPSDGTFDLSPLNADTVNTGLIQTSGIINPVQSCPVAFH